MSKLDAAVAEIWVAGRIRHSILSLNGSIEIPLTMHVVSRRINLERRRAAASDSEIIVLGHHD
jgi:hypothetical protein